MTTRAQHIREAISSCFENLTLQYHDVLCPLFWRKDEQLKPIVRKHLLAIAKKWAEFANIPPLSVKDTVFTGGHAAFNYTDVSDIDVHLLVHTTDFGDKPEVIRDYFMTKKTLWTETHTITLYGKGVEVYAQNVKDTFPRGQGVYSLTKDLWLQKPIKQKVDLNDPHIALKVDYYIKRIDMLIDHKASTAPVERLKAKLRDMRSAGLQHGGEYSYENLTYKELRNRGYLTKLSDYERGRLDTKLSLT